jgi:hypothetical protein
MIINNIKDEIMTRGRKEVPRVLRGYDLFRLNDIEISNRLSLNYHPTVHFAQVDYTTDDNFFGYIYPEMARREYLLDYLDNVKLLKKVEAEEDRLDDESVLKLLTITSKERAICSLKAFYDNN